MRSLDKINNIINSVLDTEENENEKDKEKTNNANAENDPN